MCPATITENDPSRFGISAGLIVVCEPKKPDQRQRETEAPDEQEEQNNRIVRFVDAH